MECNICHFKQSKETCLLCYRRFILDKEDSIKKPITGEPKYDTISHELGENAVTQFINYCKLYKYRFRYASKVEDTRLHYDFVVENKQFYRIEVKSMKAFKRGETPNPNLLIIELKNVLGHDGWVKGEADLIFFQQKDNFHIINRKSLLSYAEEKLKAGLSHRYTLPHHKNIPFTYSRKDRDDLLLYTTFQDYFLWLK